MEETIFTGKGIEEALKSLGLNCEFINNEIGYSNTKYEFKMFDFPTERKLKTVINQLSMMIGSQVGVQTLTGKQGEFDLFIQNEEREFPKFEHYHTSLNGFKAGTMLFGVDCDNNPITKNICDTKSILIGGASGGGKSVCMNNLIASLLFYSRTKELGICLIDLKKCEFEPYRNSNHLVYPLCDTYFKAINCFKALNQEIDRRYKYMSKHNLRQATTKDFPIIVCFIDEYYMLSSINQKEVDSYVSRVASVGRACNIYLVIATQTPTNKAISNVIRSNIQSRVCLRTMNTAQSIAIIGNRMGCDLIGKGDAYLQLDGEVDLKRCQVCSIKNETIEKLERDNY